MQITKYLLLLLLFQAASLHAYGPAADAISVKESFARATLPGMPMAAIFMKLGNRSQQEQLLVAASSPLAENTEIHGHVEIDGMMRMRQMAHVHIPANGEKVLKPGGLHIMLIGLKQKLAEGNTVPLTLYFLDSSQRSITVPVKSRTADFNQ